MKERVTPVDVAADLKTPEDVAAFVEIAFEDWATDPGAVLHALGTAARAIKMHKLANKIGMSRGGLYKALSETGNPSFQTMGKLIDAMGLEIHVTARRAKTRPVKARPRKALKKAA